MARLYLSCLFVLLSLRDHVHVFIGYKVPFSLRSLGIMRLVEFNLLLGSKYILLNPMVSAQVIFKSNTKFAYLVLN